MGDPPREPVEPDVRLEMFSQARYLAAARSMVSHLAQRLGFNDNQCGQIGLAVDEALCNVINHGYDKRPDGRIWLNVWALNTDVPAIKITVEDRAKQVDPCTIRSRPLDEIRPGGLGVHIIHEVMDDVRYEKREGGGMRLTMSKTVTHPPASNLPASNPAPTSNSAQSGTEAAAAHKLQRKDNP